MQNETIASQPIPEHPASQPIPIARTSSVPYCETSVGIANLFVGMQMEKEQNNNNDDSEQAVSSNEIYTTGSSNDLSGVFHLEM